MKIFYVREQTFTVGGQCLNCGKTFSIVNRSAHFHTIDLEGEQVKILCCPECNQIDSNIVRERIASGIKLERMNPSSEG